MCNKLVHKISIVTPTYNSEKLLEHCIKSVMNQNYQLFEHIIIDGGSTDGTINILKKYPHLKYTSEPDNGIYDAMNKGIDLCTGEIIGILNSDDYYEPDIFNKIIDIFNNYGVDLVHGNMNVCYSDNIKKINKPKSYQKYYCMWIKHPTVFVKNEVYKKYGKFNTDFTYQADYELMLRFSKNMVKFHYFDATITNFVVGGASIQNWSLKESYTIRARNGFSPIRAFLTAIITRFYFEIKLFFLYQNRLRKNG